MKEHAFVVCDIVAIRNVVAAVLRVPDQDVRANTRGNVRKQNVDGRDRAVSAPRSSEVLPLEFAVAVKLKHTLEDVQ